MFTGLIRGEKQLFSPLHEIGKKLFLRYSDRTRFKDKGLIRSTTLRGRNAAVDQTLGRRKSGASLSSFALRDDRHLC